MEAYWSTAAGLCQDTIDRALFSAVPFPALAMLWRVRPAHALQNGPGPTSSSQISSQRRQQQLLATHSDVAPSVLFWQIHGIYP